MRTIRSALSLVFLLICSVAMAEGKTVKVLIITGDHGHNWKETTPFLKEVLTQAGHPVEVTETPRLHLVSANLTKYDVLLFNYRNTPKRAKDNSDSVWNDDNKNAFIEAVRSGKGLVVDHHASSAFTGDSDFDKEFAKLSAGGWRKSKAFTARCTSFR